ncbi:hypothetical protein [Streptomyces sp. NPDC047928]|uniref:hypothetical protein n=1 Tax=unclassified Streptomyces TaxID=2593676 RepID=UPI00372199B4
MAHLVPALGVGVLTVSGCVWYLPALADLRAGDDRPVSRRTAATACLTGWTGCAAVALLLLVGGPWWLPVGAATTGGAATATLRVRAAVQRRREAAEEAHRWAALHRVTGEADAWGRAGVAGRGMWAPYRFAAWAGAGLVAATALAAVLMSGAAGRLAPVAIGGPPVLVAAAFLAVAGVAATRGR